MTVLTYSRVLSSSSGNLYLGLGSRGDREIDNLSRRSLGITMEIKCIIPPLPGAN